MLLAIDVGNSNTVIGLFPLGQKAHGKLIDNFRIETHRKMTGDELGVIIQSLISHSLSQSKVIQSLICSSVVPSLNQVITEMAEKYFHSSVFFVTHRSDTGLVFQYPNQSEIGADRIVNAVAADVIYGGPALIVDFGTATTYCALSRDHEYLGGVIAPGLSTSMEALTAKSAKLPGIDLEKPDSLLGKSTIHAMRSGIYFGAIYALEGIISQLREELSFKDAQVIVTGGFSQLITSGTKAIDIIDSQLTLKGLEILYYKNCS
ncbi:MAG: type III pantothenate kinase [bacterium]|nr:MAG: type III pantothenate kinase [bacterium]